MTGGAVEQGGRRGSGGKGVLGRMVRGLTDLSKEALQSLEGVYFRSRLNKQESPKKGA